MPRDKTLQVREDIMKGSMNDTNNVLAVTEVMTEKMRQSQASSA